MFRILAMSLVISATPVFPPREDARLATYFVQYSEQSIHQDILFFRRSINNEISCKNLGGCYTVSWNNDKYTITPTAKNGFLALGCSSRQDKKILTLETSWRWFWFWYYCNMGTLSRSPRSYELGLTPIRDINDFCFDLSSKHQSSRPISLCNCSSIASCSLVASLRSSRNPQDLNP